MNDKELCELFGTTLGQVEKDVGIYESGDLSSFEFAQIDNESTFPLDIETGASGFTDSLPKETIGATTNSESKCHATQAASRRD